MIIGRVVASVVSTIKHDVYRGKKLLLVQPLDLDQRPMGNSIVAVDLVDSGVGELVLVSSEGGATRKILEYETAPVRSIIVGVIDGIDIEGILQS